MSEDQLYCPLTRAERAVASHRGSSQSTPPFAAFTACPNSLSPKVCESATPTKITYLVVFRTDEQLQRLADDRSPLASLTEVISAGVRERVMSQNAHLRSLCAAREKDVLE